MCGIAGVWDLSKATPQVNLIREAILMASQLEHRGPDDQGHWCDESAGIGLGFQRLSILDLTSSGHQPMASQSGRYVIVFNGEFYNFKEVRESLEATGFIFRGHSDTEVFVEAIARYGVREALEKVNGMFAFALWDREQRALHLVRDRVGVKPLYWGRFGDDIIFGSELKALRSSERWSPKLNKVAAEKFHQFGYIPAPLTIYEGMEKVLPGHGMSIQADGGIDRWCYWSLAKVISEKKRDVIPEDEALARFTEVFEDAVKLQIRSDVPVGAFLSGGFDSTAVVSALVKNGAMNVQTFNVGFDDARYDESPFAREIASHLGINFNTVHMQGDDAREIASKLPEMYDEPFADSSQFPMAFVSKFARQQVTVAISGDGGDELFGGYSRYQWADTVLRQILSKPQWARRIAGTAASNLPGLLLRLLPEDKRPTNGAAAISYIGELLSARDINELYARVVALDDSVSCKMPAWFNLPELVLKEPAEQLMYLDSQIYLPDDILVKLDRASMAVGLEGRVPFLDHRLVELAWALPKLQKYTDGVGKRVVRDYVHDNVPEALMDSEKKGFSIPLDEWLRSALKPYAEDHLSGDDVTSSNLGSTQQLWDEHKNGIGNHGPALWARVSFNAWRRHWGV